MSCGWESWTRWRLFGRDGCADGESASAAIGLRRRPRRELTLLGGLLALGAIGGPVWAEEKAPPKITEKVEDVRHWLERVAGVRSVSPMQRDHASVRAAFADVVSDARRYTVRVLGNGAQVALGTIIDSDGFVLTKASELEGKLACSLADGRQFPAEIVGISDEHDLAVLRFDGHDLPSVAWSEESAPTVGSWLATVCHDRLPAAIGVVSTTTREIPAPVGFLGVGLDESLPRIIHVYAGSAADKAGLKMNDLVLSVGGKKVETREALQSQIRRRGPGQRLALIVQREGREEPINVTLGEFPATGSGDRIDFQNRLGGQLSDRRAGFPAVIQHDTILRPNECGGPLVDLEGRTIAVNIARAGRVASYAVPSNVIVPLLDELKSGKLKPDSIVGAADIQMPTSITQP